VNIRGVAAVTGRAVLQRVDWDYEGSDRAVAGWTDECVRLYVANAYSRGAACSTDAGWGAEPLDALRR
jgi:hypothetical protein